MNYTIFDWIEPLELAAAVDNLGGDFVFLYSSLLTKYSGRYSYLAYSPVRYVKNKLELEKSLEHGKWFGYLSYEAFAKKDSSLKKYINLPDLLIVQFAEVITFDHVKHKLYSSSSQLPQTVLVPCTDVCIEKLYSNMTKNQYCQNIEKTLDAIIKGDFYQANITRKFYGTLGDGFNALSIFANLCKESPSPYGAFLKFCKQRIISSSPEMFLKLSADGAAENNLIKGSAPRFSDPEQDQLSKITLQNSEKDKSENIMIVDLMRNDFAIGSYPDSIQVEDLYKIYSYQTIHHALSTVKSQKRKEISPLQFVNNCFPAGSITGAPKIQVMQWCRAIEKWQRGIYTGSIGWFDDDGSLDLSVVIRTIIIEDNKFEFQVGGGIVYESTPENEWHETLIKAYAMAKVLGIDMATLKSL